MDRQRAGIADIGNMVEEFQGVDKPATSIDAAIELKADKATVTAG